MIWWRVEETEAPPTVDPLPDLGVDADPQPVEIPQVDQGVQRERPRRPQVTLEGLMADPSRWVGGRARW